MNKTGLRIGLLSGVMALGVSTVRAESLGLFEILRHEVNGGGTIQLFDGSPPESEFISVNDPDDGDLGFSVYDYTGTGSGNSSIGSGGFSTMNVIPGPNPGFGILSDLSIHYVGSGPNRPGGVAEGEWHSIVEFVMPVEQLDWVLIFTQDVDPGFTQSSMITVENVTQNEVLATADSQLVFEDILVANVGDVIRVSADFVAEGTAPANVSGLFNSGARLSILLTIPEPQTVVLLMIGGWLCLLTRRSRPR